MSKVKERLGNGRAAIEARGKAKGWVVSTGSEEWRVRADSAEEALRVAFTQREPSKPAGLLTRICPAGETAKAANSLHIATAGLLMNCGYTVLNEQGEPYDGTTYE
jgi:hypothetical protein